MAKREQGIQEQIEALAEHLAEIPKGLSPGLDLQETCLIKKSFFALLTAFSWSSHLWADEANEATDALPI